MTEDLRNIGAQRAETPIDVMQTLVEEVNRIVQVSENPAWDSNDHRGTTREGYFGGEIQGLVQSYLTGVRERGLLPQGRVGVGNGVVLNFSTLELYSTRRDPNDRTVGGSDWPLNPDAWFRNYQGILDQVVRI